MKQFTKLIAKVDFTFGYEGKRKLNVKIGDIFLVTSPEYMNTNNAKVMRERVAKLNQGYNLQLEQISQLFTFEQH